MAKGTGSSAQSPEIKAISSVYGALKGLDPEAQGRVLRYAAEMLGIAANAFAATGVVPPHQDDVQKSHPISHAGNVTLPDAQVPEEADGISAVALKWMRRSELNPKGLQAFFSLGVDDIDLVAGTVPGTGKKERMRNVLLLKGVAAYLGTGAARITYETLKEACLHYNAYDSSNFAKFLKSFASEVGGTREAGFTLTARGLNSATLLVKEMLNSKG